MKKKDLELRRKNNTKANELLMKSIKEKLTQEEIEELKLLHTGYGGIGDNTQYFTPKPVVNYIMDVLKIVGFKGGNVLEPSCGNGIFIDAIHNTFEFDYRVFMATTDSIGWDSRGNETSNGLIPLLKKFESYYNEICEDEIDIFFK